MASTDDTAVQELENVNQDENKEQSEVVGNGSAEELPATNEASQTSTETTTAATEVKKDEPLPTDEEIDAMTHTEYYNKLVEQGFKKPTAFNVEKLVANGNITEEDLDARALNALKEFDVKHADSVMKEFSTSDLSHVMNKSAYLCGMLKTFRQRLHMKDTNTSTPATVGPTKEQLENILKSGYTLDITTGQRKYGGPPPDWEGPAPGAGHEVFVGRIPRDLFEDVLVPVFEKAGKIWDFRLMIDSLSGYNRGYAFCTYCTKDGAKGAVKDIDDYEIQPGKKIKVNISVANVRLFAGNIPKQKSKEEIREEFSKLTEGLTDVIVYQNPGETMKKNRGFAFLEYDSHKSASSAKRKLGTGRCRVWGCDLIIDWADPLEEPSEERMATVKVLYVKGLLSDVTEESIKEKFEPYGTLDRVRKVKDYAFVHFAEREHALTAMNDLNNQKLGDSTMDISLAKPQDNKNKEKRRQRDGGPGGPFRGGPPMRGFGGRGGGFGMRRGGFGGPVPDWSYGGGYDDWGYNFDGPYGGYDGYGYGPPPPMRGGRGAWRGPMGGRGGPRGGRGGPRGAGPRGGGFKRPMHGGPEGGNKKPRSLMDQGWSQPIAQQPLGGGEFYQDSW